jgi:hypothetical protein
MASSFLRRSSSRLRLGAGAAALDVVAGALAIGSVICATARCAPHPSDAGGRVNLMLEVRTAPADVERAPASDTSPGGLTLALNAMSDAERSRMAVLLGRVADRLERDHNPLVEDLDDGDPRADIHTLGHERLPTLTAAAALAPGQWQSADGRMFVRATAACDPGARCLPLGVKLEASDDRVAARARFLAWPLAYGIVLRPEAAREQAVVDALRAPADESRIALVLGEGDLHALRFSEALLGLADSATRIAQWAPEDAPMKDLFRRLSSRDAVRDDAPWLALPSGALLVVPRLGALATIDAFVDEVRARAGAVAPRIEWLALPPS